MNTYVLVPGAWHGAWCWYKTIPLLQKAGHRAIAVDLPGHGRDWTPVSEISLRTYVDSVCRILDDQTDPVILVGHSRAGIVISQTAEQRPGKIKTLVYLAAFLIASGEAMLPVGMSDSESLINANLVVDEGRGYIMLKEEAFRDALYGDCSDADVTLASSLLTPEPLAPMATQVELSEENYGQVPRVYIHTLRDRGLTPTLQRRMVTALPCQTTISMDTSHSPFLSAPEELVDHLTAL